MKTPRLMAHSTSEVPLDVPASALDLPAWLFGFSDTEYQGCAKGHFGAGASTLPDGRRTSVNVESVGGHLGVHHYMEEISKPDRLRLVSEKSDAWLFHLLHVRPRVTWDMMLVPTSPASCIFRCTVLVEHPSLVLKLASLLALFPYFVRRHDHEETRLFAENLRRHASSRAPAPLEGSLPA